ncbi:MAG: hypothetical protein ABI036_10475, partial [Fibrobacteria bacterium]
MPTEAGGRQNGLALASVLSIVMVLALLGSAVYRNVNTDITHSGKDSKRVRAEYAAESAVQWGLVELGRARPGMLPFTLATHAYDGETKISEVTKRSAETGPWPVLASDFTGFSGAKIGMDAEGWMYMHITASDKTISGGKDELL